MGWLMSLFTKHQERRGQVLSSTHQAFELATDSPSPASAAFTYPPSSLLPTHHNPLHTPYPPLRTTWNRLRAWLDREYPELGDTLNYGILPDDLANIELQLGFTLPPPVRDSYLCVDGQEAESAAGCSEGLFFGLTLLPLEDVLEEWRFWREVDDDPQTGANQNLRELMHSIPPGWIHREYSQRGWLPLIADKVGNYVGIDLSPDQDGSAGQVIVFGRDFDTKVVLYPGDGPAGWAKWLANFVDELESGEGFELGRADASDSSEDDLGYESYFYDGNGRGHGDGGGDNGSGGGLRLTGEYKGWNVMEAWADRSVRKWHELGLISSPSLENRKGKEKDNMGLSVVDQVPDPQVAIEPGPDDAGDESPSTEPRAHPLGNVTNTGKRARQLPTISVTKPPVPMPVDLPTPNDILAVPSPPLDSNDLELGQNQDSGALSTHSLEPSSDMEFGAGRAPQIPIERAERLV